MDSMCVILSLSSWYYCVSLGDNAIIIMILLLLFGARYHYHHDSIGALWGNLMIPLGDITVFLFLGFFFPAGDLSCSQEFGGFPKIWGIISGALIRILYLSLEDWGASRTGGGLVCLPSLALT